MRGAYDLLDEIHKKGDAFGWREIDLWRSAVAIHSGGSVKAREIYLYSSIYVSM